MELIKNFGIDPFLLGAQIVNFLIIFFILKKFAFKPILGILKSREKTIKDGLKDAEEGHKLLEEAIEKEKSILKNAQLNAEQILSDAKNQASEIIKKAEDKAKVQAEEILKDADAKIDQEYKETEKKLAMKISQIAVEFLEKSLKNVFGNDKQQELMKIALRKMREAN